MKHADSVALGALNGLLEQLRELPGLVEKKQGIFYVKSSAYLHFHEGDAGLFADVKLSGGEFERFAVNTLEEQRTLLTLIQANRVSKV